MRARGLSSAGIVHCCRKLQKKVHIEGVQDVTRCYE
jgi:hypothetical protein